MSDSDVLRLARQRYQEGVDADRENRDLDAKQRRFYRGRKTDQWEAADLSKRSGRITVAINRVPQFAKQITGEMKQNKPAIKVLPVDDQTDPELAEVYTAIIRHIESQSDAQRVYSKAGEQAVIGGMGWFRLLTDYRDGKSFDQEILIKSIRNPLSVVTDPGATESLRQDMQWAIVSELIPEETFKAKYPKAKMSGFDNDDRYLSSWYSDNKIRVAEYWTRTAQERELILLTNGDTLWEDELTPELIGAYSSLGVGVRARRTSERWKVECRKITGVEVLEQYDWEGSFIPLIPVIGEEIEVGDEVFRHGITYPTMDSQRSYNFARSAMLETVAAQPKAPFLVTTKMVAAHKAAWEKLNEGNPPVLPYDPDPMAPQGPQRLSPPNMATAWYQEAMVADGDMKAVTGIYDASLGEKSNETSGVAIRARDQQGETASYVYIDNQMAAVRHCGRMLIELIPKIYTGERVIRIMGEDGALERFSRINQILPDGRIENDISVGQFDLEVSIGPAFATKRAEAAERMMSLVQAVPAIGQYGADMIIKAMDMPYGDKLAERLGMALIPPGMDEELDKRRMEMQQSMGPPQPDPMQEIAMADAVAEIENKKADTALKIAKAESEEFQTASSAFSTGMQAGMGDGP